MLSKHSSYSCLISLLVSGLAALSLAACGSSKEDCKDGDEGCQCFPNKTCNDDLSCFSNICVDPNDQSNDGKPNKTDPDASGSSKTGDNNADAGTASNGGDPASGNTTAPGSDTGSVDNTDPSASSSSDPSGSDATDTGATTAPDNSTSSNPVDVNTDAPSGSPVARHGQLRVVGTKIVDDNDEVVQLKGVSSMWLNWEDDGYAEDKAGLAYMRDNWNLSLIRAAMGIDPAGAYLDDPTKARKQVETIVDNAIELGVYVIIDWHDHEGLSHQADAQAFFSEMAAKYGDTPNVLYEVFNEPLDLSWSSELKPYHEALRDTIRAEDSDNIVILGTPNWDQDVDAAAASPLSGSNLMYTLHFYSCDHGSAYRSVGQQALNAGLPIFVTEWGAATADGIDACGTSEAAAWHDWMDDNAISWAAWKFDNCADATCFFVDSNVPTSGNWTSDQINGVHPEFAIERMKRVPESNPVTDPDPVVNGCQPTGSCADGDAMDCDASGALISRDCRACDLIQSCTECCDSVGYFGAISQPPFTIEPNLVDSYVVDDAGATLSMSFDFSTYYAYEQIGAIAFALNGPYAVDPGSLTVCMDTNAPDYIQASLEDGDSGCLYWMYVLSDGCAFPYDLVSCWGDWSAQGYSRQINVRVASETSSSKYITVKSISW